MRPWVTFWRAQSAQGPFTACQLIPAFSFALCQGSWSTFCGVKHKNPKTWEWFKILLVPVMQLLDLSASTHTSNGGNLTLLTCLTWSPNRGLSLWRKSKELGLQQRRECPAHLSAHPLPTCSPSPQVLCPTNPHCTTHSQKTCSVLPTWPAYSPKWSDSQGHEAPQLKWSDLAEENKHRDTQVNLNVRWATNQFLV